MKIKHAINLHKGLTAFVVLGLMFVYQNFAIAPWIYLALHGTYGFLWLLKDRIYPDKQWEEEVSIPMGIGTFLVLCSYWVAPWLLIHSGVTVPVGAIAGAVFLNIFGVFLHYTSDAQKYYTLKYQKGLISEGFFARCRNTNYLGEILIYGSFALLSWHWIPFAILGAFAALIFIPNMRKKDQSLSRYPEFGAYRDRSGLILPKLLPNLLPLPEDA
jgi:protein-S-isoprenylcysteine O-methyltransferase Ste14